MIPMKPTPPRLARVLLTVALLTGGAAVFAGPALLPEIPKARMEADPETKCVKPVADMRRNHMNYILHQRDETVHLGIRTERFSLANCVSCHVQQDAAGQFVPINAEGQFCQTCHEYSAVKIDCFECHAAVPND
jgi:hypothetical protein